MYLGGEKLKSLRIAILAAIVAAGILTIGISAQEVGGEAVSAESLDVSPALLAETPVAEEDFLIPWDAPSGTAGGGGSSIFVVIRIVLVLGLAAAAIYGVVFFIKKVSRPPEQRNSNLRVLTSASLGTNRFVYVVSVGTKAWLLGAGDGGGVSLIAEVTDQEAIDAMLLEDSRKAAESASRFQDFRALLRRLGGKPPVSAAQSFSGGDFVPGSENQGFAVNGGGFSAAGLRKRRERLKGL
ncbi:hypothetical protein FACS189483_02240 [Spirochaetia bacterium]|nr:hypothetical protein FACS189483_02240 [Spirochaetia bacterium]